MIAPPLLAGCAIVEGVVGGGDIPSFARAATDASPDCFLFFPRSTADTAAAWSPATPGVCIPGWHRR